MKNDINEQFDRVRDFAGETAGAAAEKLKEARDSAAETLARSKDKAAVVYNDARDKSYKAADRANSFVQEHPIAATAVAAVAGAAFAMLFPKGRALIRSAPGAFASLGASASKAASVAVEALEHRAEDARSGAARAATEARSAIGHAGSKAADVADAAVALAKDAVSAAGKAADKLRR